MLRRPFYLLSYLNICLLIDSFVYLSLYIFSEVTVEVFTYYCMFLIDMSWLLEFMISFCVSFIELCHHLCILYHIKNTPLWKTLFSGQNNQVVRDHGNWPYTIENSTKTMPKHKMIHTILNNPREKVSAILWSRAQSLPSKTRSKNPKIAQRDLKNAQRNLKIAQNPKTALDRYIYLYPVAKYILQFISILGLCVVMHVMSYRWWRHVTKCPFVSAVVDTNFW